MITNTVVCCTSATELNPVNVPQEKISLKLMAVF